MDCCRLCTNAKYATASAEISNMLGFGWCHLRSTREPLRKATIETIEAVDSEIDRADERLWFGFREWMAAHPEPYIQWQFHERLNNDEGLLTFCVSRNHRTSSVWEMLDWIATNGSGSYGLFYCHDDEDTMNGSRSGRQPPMDYDNTYRVHRLLNGELIELSDPFFGAIEGSISPVHPFNRADGG